MIRSLLAACFVVGSIGCAIETSVPEPIEEVPEADDDPAAQNGRTCRTFSCPGQTCICTGGRGNCRPRCVTNPSPRQ
jgi:hypothetical protein